MQNKAYRRRKGSCFSLRILRITLLLGTVVVAGSAVHLCGIETHGSPANPPTNPPKSSASTQAAVHQTEPYRV